MAMMYLILLMYLQNIFAYISSFVFAFWKFTFEAQYNGSMQLKCLPGKKDWGQSIAIDPCGVFESFS